MLAGPDTVAADAGDTVFIDAGDTVVADDDSRFEDQPVRSSFRIGRAPRSRGACFQVFQVCERFAAGS